MPENNASCDAAILAEPPLATVKFSKPLIVAPEILPPLPIDNVSVPVLPAKIPIALTEPILRVSSPVLPVKFCPAAPRVNAFGADKTYVSIALLPVSPSVAELIVIVSVPGAVNVVKLSCCASVINTLAPLASVNDSKADIVAPLRSAPVPACNISVPAAPFNVPVTVKALILTVSSALLPVTFCAALPSVKIIAAPST